MKYKKNLNYLLLALLVALVISPSLVMANTSQNTIIDTDSYPLNYRPNMTKLTLEPDGIRINISNFDSRPFTDPDADLYVLLIVGTVLYIDLDSNALTGFNGTAEYSFEEDVASPGAFSAASEIILEETPNIPIGTDIIMVLWSDIHSYLGAYYYLDPVLAFYPNGTSINLLRSPALEVEGDLANMTDYLQINDNSIWLNINWTYIYNIYMNLTNTTIEPDSAIVYLLSQPSYDWGIFPFGNTFIFMDYKDIFNNTIDNPITLQSLTLDLDGDLTEWTSDYLLGIDHDVYSITGLGFDKIYAAANDTHIMFGIQLDNPLLGDIGDGDIYYRDYILSFITTLDNGTDSYTLSVNYNGGGDSLSVWANNSVDLSSYSTIQLNDEGDQLELIINVSAANNPSIFAGEGTHISLDSASGTTFLKDALYVPYNGKNVTYIITEYNFTSGELIPLGTAWFYQQYLPDGNNIIVTDQNLTITMNLSSPTVFFYGYSPINLASPTSLPPGTILGYYYFSLIDPSNLLYPITINITIEPTSNTRIYYYDKYANSYVLVPATNIQRGYNWIKITFDENMYNRGDPIFLIAYGPAVGGELIQNNLNNLSLIIGLAVGTILLSIIYLRLIKK